MKRAAFTIKTKAGKAYDANHLSITGEYDSNYGGIVSVLAFVCSGAMQKLRATDVESVTFSEASAGHCSECESSIFEIIGGGIHDTMDKAQ